MVAALALQKRYLPLAELEPQLWYDPFPASAYQGMVEAQEEVRNIPGKVDLEILVSTLGLRVAAFPVACGKDRRRRRLTEGITELWFDASASAACGFDLIGLTKFRKAGSERAPIFALFFLSLFFFLALFFPEPLFALQPLIGQETLTPLHGVPRAFVYLVGLIHRNHTWLTPCVMPRPQAAPDHCLFDYVVLADNPLRHSIPSPIIPRRPRFHDSCCVR